MPNVRTTRRALTCLLAGSLFLAACGDSPSLVEPQPSTPSGTPVTSFSPGEVPGGAGAAALVGVWRASYQDPAYGPASSETVLQGSGSFSQTTVYSEFGSQLYITGTYEVLEAESLIRFTFENYEPKEFCGPVTCSPVNIGEGETVAFSFSDLNTLHTDSQGCDGPSCELTHTRTA